MTGTTLLPSYPELDALLRVAVAGAVAILVGLDRELKDKPAGVRTYALVGMGSALFTVAGALAFPSLDSSARIAAQIVTGIGFLGAGTILHLRRSIVGLTTAAGLWAVAAAGMAIGLGLYVLGIGAAVLMVLVFRFLKTAGIEGREHKGAWRDALDAEDGPLDG